MSKYLHLGRDAIIQTLESNDTVIVMGETGSGKTTRKLTYIEFWFDCRN